MDTLLCFLPESPLYVGTSTALNPIRDGTPTNFAERVKELVSGHPTLQTIADSLLAVREVLLREFRGYEKRVRATARHSEDARLLMTTTGVGAVMPSALAGESGARTQSV